MNQLIKVFKALSDASRIRILKILEERSLCVCEITDVLGLAPSTVSKHLSILQEADLIFDRKDGKWVYYDLNLDQSDKYIRHLLPLIRTWISDDEIILSDMKRAVIVDREEICNTK